MIISWSHLETVRCFLKEIGIENQKRQGRRNAKVIGRCDVTISYDGN